MKKTIGYLLERGKEFKCIFKSVLDFYCDHDKFSSSNTVHKGSISQFCYQSLTLAALDQNQCQQDTLVFEDFREETICVHFLSLVR